jgi:hypothetical protein
MKSPAEEMVVNDHSSAVNYHIDAIRSSGDGEWNERMARDYVQGFEAQIEEEIQAAGMDNPDADINEADDPVRELGVSSNELRDELDKLDPERGTDYYDSEDVREYMEDADEDGDEKLNR